MQWDLCAISWVPRSNKYTHKGYKYSTIQLCVFYCTVLVKWNEVKKSKVKFSWCQKCQPARPSLGWDIVGVKHGHFHLQIFQQLTAVPKCTSILVKICLCILNCITSTLNTTTQMFTSLCFSLCIYTHIYIYGLLLRWLRHSFPKMTQEWKEMHVLMLAKLMKMTCITD